ncbi:MAG: hypothetical protein ACK4UP_08555 [Spirosomataceae bacterium]
MEQDKQKHTLSTNVPDKDFFKALEERLSAIPLETKLDWKLELRDKNMFQVPTSYFDSLEARLLSKTIQSKQLEKKSPFGMITWARFAAAASVLLIGAASLVYMMDSASSKSVVTELETVTEAEIIAYLESSGTGNFVLEDFESLQIPVSTNLENIDAEDLKEYADEFGI